MRRSASWQSVWDDRILEIAINDEDGAVSVSELVDNDLVRISQSTISRRCSKLADEGLLRKISAGTYIITDEGEAYLRGEYDAEEGVYLDKGAKEEPTAGAEQESNGGV